MQDQTTQLAAGEKAFAGLLYEFRKQNIANDKAGRASLKRHTAELSDRWDKQFSGFPQSRFPYLSFVGLARRGPRNTHLKKIIIQYLTSDEQTFENKVVVNPACFLGRRARWLASRLKSFKIIATDINPRYNSFWKHFCKTPANFEFQKDSIFNPMLKAKPAAVVFFGACGSVTDAAMDYYIKSGSPYLFCRTCCQDIIGGNMESAKNFSLASFLWGVRMPILRRMYEKKPGHYFSPDYSMDRYPRSQMARSLTNSKEFLDICRYATGSGICRTLIDVDRYLYLVEHGYNVWYRGEMFIAIKDNKDY